MFRLLVLKFVVPSALLAIFVGPAAAVAAIIEPSDAAPRRVVKFADLDLTRSEGAAVLYSRISAAAREVCELQLSLPNMQSQTYACRHLAIAKAIADVGSQTLTKYYLTKSGYGIKESQQ
jgi:UrcA family protein